MNGEEIPHVQLFVKVFIFRTSIFYSKRYFEFQQNFYFIQSDQ